MGAIGAAAWRYAQHADAWLPIMSMWEFSVMFSAAPYFFSPVAVMAMLGAVGLREQELLPAGGVGRQPLCSTLEPSAWVGKRVVSELLCGCV